MYFIWDKYKNILNKQKHGLSFEFAQKVFNDPYGLSWLDNNKHLNEERWITLRSINQLLIVIVIHTFRSDENGEEIIRIISARKANKKEQQKYFARNDYTQIKARN